MSLAELSLIAHGLCALSVLAGCGAFIGALLWARERGNAVMGIGDTQGRHIEGCPQDKNVRCLWPDCGAIGCPFHREPTIPEMNQAWDRGSAHTAQKLTDR